MWDHLMSYHMAKVKIHPRVHQESEEVDSTTKTQRPAIYDYWKSMFATIIIWIQWGSISEFCSANEVTIMLAKTPFKDLTRDRSLVVQIFGDFTCKYERSMLAGCKCCGDSVQSYIAYVRRYSLPLLYQQSDILWLDLTIIRVQHYTCMDSFLRGTFLPCKHHQHGLLWSRLLVCLLQFLAKQVKNGLPGKHTFYCITRFHG